MTRFTRTATALGVLVLVAAPLSLWPTAGGSQGTSFYVDCAFSPANGLLRVHIRDEEGLVRRRGEQIRVLEPTGSAPPRPQWEAIDCGGSPTVNNTDRIRIRIDSVGSTTGRLSLHGGPFAPGLTSETGIPEIEIVAVASEEDQGLLIGGTPQDDRFRAGRLDGAEWMNLNPDAESADADGDLRLPGGRALLGLVTRKGNDDVALDGGPEFDGPVGPRFVLLRLGKGADYYSGHRPSAFVFPGAGADTIVTGRHRDGVLDRNGRDSISTGDARDFVIALGGKDRILTGEGDDRVYAKDGRPDWVRCGKGFDRAALDARDRARSCERDLEFSKSTLSDVAR